MERAKTAGWSPASLVLLGNTLADAGDVDGGVRVLRQASAVHPTDVWVQYTLGYLLEHMTPPRWDEAIASYFAARALRPELAHEAAHALEICGRPEEAEAVFRDLVHRRPLEGRHLSCLGGHLQERGRAAEAAPILEQAIAAGREAVRLRPLDTAAQINLAVALERNGQVAEAIAQYRKVIELDPTEIRCAATWAMR